MNTTSIIPSTLVIMWHTHISSVTRKLHYSTSHVLTIILSGLYRDLNKSPSTSILSFWYFLPDFTFTLLKNPPENFLRPIILIGFLLNMCQNVKTRHVPYLLFQYIQNIWILFLYGNTKISYINILLIFMKNIKIW